MPDFSPGSVFAGHRIEGVAGRGGMGVVYRATDLRLERPVALKVIVPELVEDGQFRRRFERESKTAASIRHPHVIPIHRADEHDGVLYITMDYIEGTDLRGLISQRGRLERGHAARIVSEVADALDTAHAEGLVHRDIKPANVLIEQRRGREHTYLTDFGLTKRLSADSGLKTATGLFVGTLDYMAPEQIEGGTVDARTDVYSLGCLLYEALVGQVPYPQADVAKMWAHMSKDIPSARAMVPDLPAEIDEVIRRSMAKSPDDRYLSAGDFGAAALAAVERRTVTRAERSVAEGEAATGNTPVGLPPTDATVSPPSDAPVEPQPPPSDPPVTPAPEYQPPPQPAGDPYSAPAYRAPEPPGTWSTRAPAPALDKNTPAVVGLVFGIVGLVIFLIGGIIFIPLFISLACSITALFVGRTGVRKVDRGETSVRRGAGRAGYITGIVGTVLSLLGIIAWILIIALSEDFQQSFEEGFEGSSGGVTLGLLALAARALS